ncbi:MAG: glucose-1-phosphate cytidylyltransferase [Actinomycetes bacterium]
MKALLLAGGLGTRLREETEFKPKPMVEVGGRPIIWHIMKSLSQHGIEDFVVATGYKSDVIKEYFLDYEARNNDFTISLGQNRVIDFHDAHDEGNWKVTLAFTGELTMTGGRVKRSEKYLADERFLCTYGDGLSDINISDLLDFHKSHGKLATVTTVQPSSRFGIMDVEPSGLVKSFKEKPKVEGWINVGYFIFEPEVFKYLDNDCILEQEPLAKLASDGQLMAYRHEGFWQPMDTYREATMLNEMWDHGTAPWKSWK